MLEIPAQVKNEYTHLLTQREVPRHSHNTYLKWLRFYLDFCNKYHHAPNRRASLPLFIKKLHEKGQTVRQQKQAGHAINRYYAFQEDDVAHDSATPAAVRTQEQAAWDQLLSDLHAAIKVRHYSPKTYKSYAGWARQFQGFTHDKSPELLTADDVKSFLTNLAVKRKVSASTQNQAFNALLFVFRHIVACIISIRKICKQINMARSCLAHSRKNPRMSQKNLSGNGSFRRKR